MTHVPLVIYHPSCTISFLGTILYHNTPLPQSAACDSFVVSVPVIVENQCRTYTYSIQLHSPSPLTSPLHATGVEHYLLYREASVNKIWKSISLYGRVDHRVFGLEPDTLYDFVVMACDTNCECQVSNMVTMRTERSAY